MASKGDRAVLEPTAIRLYGDGHSLTEISRQLGVSVTSLAKWKKESHHPGRDLDEWDRVRKQKGSIIQRLKDRFEQELAYMEKQPAGTLSAPDIDALSKLGALVQRWEAVERDEAAAGQVAPEIDRPAVFLENLQWLAARLKESDPEGLKVLGRNFDGLILQFKAEFTAV